MTKKFVTKKYEESFLRNMCSKSLRKAIILHALFNLEDKNRNIKVWSKILGTIVSLPRTLTPLSSRTIDSFIRQETGRIMTNGFNYINKRTNLYFTYIKFTPSKVQVTKDLILETESLKTRENVAKINNRLKYKSDKAPFSLKSDKTWHNRSSQNIFDYEYPVQWTFLPLSTICTIQDVACLSECSCSVPITSILWTGTDLYRYYESRLLRAVRYFRLYVT